jgi:hypothetical protein
MFQTVADHQLSELPKAKLEISSYCTWEFYLLLYLKPTGGTLSHMTTPRCKGGWEISLFCPEKQTNKKKLRVLSWAWWQDSVHWCPITGVVEMVQ